jgi:hypothetical protein
MTMGVAMVCGSDWAKEDGAGASRIARNKKQSRFFSMKFSPWRRPNPF